MPLAAAEGQYVATTTAGDWLDRIAVHGLGIRTNAELSVHPARRAPRPLRRRAAVHPGGRA